MKGLTADDLRACVKKDTPVDFHPEYEERLIAEQTEWFLLLIPPLKISRISRIGRITLQGDPIFEIDVTDTAGRRKQNFNVTREGTHEGWGMPMFMLAESEPKTIGRCCTCSEPKPHQLLVSWYCENCGKDIEVWK